MPVLVRSAYRIPLFAVKADSLDEDSIDALTAAPGCLATRLALSYGAIVTRRAAELCGLRGAGGVECGDVEALALLAAAELGDPVAVIVDAP